MEDNIGVKDVQKTEYLDKNGLDMLWTKIKENTHNQVEVERNRAVAKENSITNSFSDFVSKTITDAQTINSDLLINRGSLAILGGTGPEDEETEDKKREGLGLFPTLIQFGEDNDTSGIELRGNAAAGPVSENGDGYITGSCINIETRRKNPSIQLYSTISRTDSHKSNIGDSLTIDNRSVFIRDTNEVYSSGSDDTFEVQGLVRGANLTATCISLQDKQSNNGIIIENNPTDNYIMLSHGTNQAKYLKITGGGITCNGGSVSSGDGLFFEANGRLSDIYYTNGQDVVRQFDSLNTEVSNQGVFVGNNTADGQRGIQITGNGIQVEETTQVPVNRSPNKVFATDGSIADLTQYAKKSEISAGGNVNDVQVNGVSVVENKVANIKPATKEKLGVVKVGDGLNVTNGTISVDKGFLIDMVSYGVEWDTTVADPACTRIGNMSYHKSLPIQSEYKGCLVKNGKVNYYLDPNDWSKKADGTPSVLDGTDGDVMVHIPKFYGKSGSNGNKRWVRISTIKVDSSWVEVPEMFVSAYRITTFDDSGTSKIASVVNTATNYRGGSNRSNYDQYLSTDKFRTDLGKPRTNINRSTMRTNASNSGQELLCYEFYKWVFYWAYVIEYANFNSQKEFNSEFTPDGYHQGGLGPGLTTFSYSSWGTYNEHCAITPCGYTNEFGNFSGVKTIQIQSPETTLYANRWRGFENPFGDISTNLEGIVIKRDKERANSNVYTTTDVSKYGEDYSSFNIAGVEIGDYGWIKTFNIGSKAEIIPSSVDGSQSTYKCDFIYCNPYSTVKRWLCVGGNASNGAKAGLGFLASDNDLDASNYSVGFRSVIRA